MCRKPRSRPKRIAWLKRYARVLSGHLAAGFVEAWYRKRHYTVEAQERDCRRRLEKAQAELRVLA